MKNKEEVVEKGKVAFKLPKETVTVKFVAKRKGMAAHVEDNHVISGGMLTNSVKRFQCPLHRSNEIANILSNEEKEHLEELTGQNLSVYGDFWKKYTVPLRKDDASNIFDLSNPFEFISVRILENYPNEIAKTWKQRNDRVSIQFAITRPDELTNEKKAKLDVKKMAFKMFGKIEDDREYLAGILKLLANAPISKSAKLEWLQGNVQEHVDINPKRFVELMNDTNLETKLLINSAIEAGVIKKQGNKYTTIDGLELCEASETATLNNTIRFLGKDKNQEIRLLIEARVSNA